MTQTTQNSNAAQSLPVHRVGSITSGLFLVVFGIVLLITMFVPTFNVQYVMRFAPLMLVALGVEIILASRHTDKYVIKYDFAAVIMCIFVSGASLCMTLFAMAANNHMI